MVRQRHLWTMRGRVLAPALVLRLLALVSVVLAVAIPVVAQDGPPGGPASTEGGSRSFAGPGPAGPVEVRWELGVPEGYRAGEPVTTKDQVLVTATSDEFGSNLTVYDLASGGFLWNYAEEEPFSDPYAGDGFVYLEQGSRRFALDLETGEVVWDVTLDDGEIARGGEFPHVTAAGGVAFTNHNSTLFALDGETGEELWRRTFAGYAVGAPIIAGDVVVASSTRADGETVQIITRVHGISRESGNEVWRRDARNLDVQYVSGNGELVAIEEYSAMDSVWTSATMVDARDGQVVWDAGQACGPDGPNIFVYGDVVLCHGTGTLLDAATGASLADTVTLMEDQGPIAATGETLYVATAERTILAIDLASGETMWTFDVAAASGISDEDAATFRNLWVGEETAVVDFMIYADGAVPSVSIFGIGGPAAGDATPVATPAS